VKRGEQCSHSKLKEADVIEIRRLRASGLVYREIAAKFGVHLGHIFDIVKGIAWKHVPNPDQSDPSNHWMSCACWALDWEGS
jgi:hypothetical protein